MRPTKQRERRRRLATILTAGAEGDKAQANQAAQDAATAEEVARERFHEAEKKAFEKDQS